jgi:hypothetical protein
VVWLENALGCRGYGDEFKSVPKGIDKKFTRLWSALACIIGGHCLVELETSSNATCTFRGLNLRNESALP